MTLCKYNHGVEKQVVWDQQMPQVRSQPVNWTAAKSLIRGKGKHTKSLAVVGQRLVKYHGDTIFACKPDALQPRKEATNE